MKTCNIPREQQHQQKKNVNLKKANLRRKKAHLS